MSIIISAVICTHNRERFIGRAVASLLEQTLDKDSYEIIVVDNRSTDNTARIVKGLASGEPNIRYIFASNLGLSFARNTGWQNARGRYAAFLDDDAIASPGWLSHIVERFEKGDQTIAGLGGKVDPIWEVPPPPWLTGRLKRSLAIVDWGESPRFLSRNQWLAGVNVAYRKTVLKKFNGFNTALGRKGKNLLSMEEIFLEDRLADNGLKSYYDPCIFVRHHIPASRLSRKWFFKRYFWQGISEARSQLLTTLAGTAYLTRLKRTLSYSRTLFLPAGWVKKISRRAGTNPNTDVNKKSGTRPTPFELICFSVRKIGYITGLLWKYKN